MNRPTVGQPVLIGQTGAKLHTEIGPGYKLRVEAVGYDWLVLREGQWGATVFLNYDSNDIIGELEG